MQIYLETDFIIISYDQAGNIIISQWLTPPTPGEFREGANNAILAMEHFKTGKVIWNVQKLGTIHPDDQQWATTEWYQKALKAGFSHQAVIMPPDVFTQMSVENTVSPVTATLPSAYFDNMESALWWIKQF